MMKATPRCWQIGRKRVGGAGDGGVVDALQTQLEGRDVAAVERGAEFVGEDRRMLDAFGRDQVEAAAFGGRHAYILP